MKVADASLHAGGARRRAVQGLRRGTRFAQDDWIAEERPIALEFNGIGHAVMLATPLDLEDFALGFALSEAIVDTAQDVHALEVHEAREGWTVSLQVATRCMVRLKARRRAMAGRTGCGLCGVESLKQVERPLPPLAPSTPIERSAITRALSELQGLQVLQQATGSVHAAGWCTAQGELQWLREDVGRHNALDKLVGALATAEIDAAQGFVVVTSRASFEMVHKTATARVPLLAAVSAATTMAVDLASQLKLALAGFARQGDLVIYAGAERLRLEEGGDER